MGEVKQYKAEQFLPTKCSLGEAPFWDSRKNVLRFVDIEKNEVHKVDLNIGPSSHKVVAKLDISIGITANIKDCDDKFVFAGKHGYGIFDENQGTYKYVREIWSGEEKQGQKAKEIRFNDGGCDSAGRFWAGTMNDPLVVQPFRAEGTLYRLDSDLSLHEIFDNCTIPNGMSWTEDDQTMYFTETQDSCIYKFDYNSKDGGLSNKQEFFKPKPADKCAPDGHAQDEHGYLWVALFNGSKVVHVSPAGEVVGEIPLPTRNPSCAVFAGETLYITTAAEQEEDRYPDSAKHAGNVFRCHVGVQGLRRHEFQLHDPSILTA